MQEKLHTAKHGVITHIDMSIINNGQIEIGIDVVTKITMLTPQISMKRWFKVAIRFYLYR